MQRDNAYESYDIEQEVAQSAYADMLHDLDRNQRYHEALRHVIISMKASGQEVHVLDIGSGTGLLSMMAARAGADSIVACEAFGPVAECAQRILRVNRLADRVNLIHKHSTDLVVGEDMPRKANVLVAEIFDTELIGEGALKTYRHAADNLLTEDAILIPCKAKMFLQIVESPFLWSHNQIEPFEGEFCFPTEEMSHCRGSPAVFDLHVSRLKFVHQAITKDDNVGAVRCLLEKPLMFHEFNFAPPSSLQLEEVKRIAGVNGEPIKTYVNGTAHAVIVWWELQMEPSNHVPSITMAPEGAGPCAGPDDPRATPMWREHWMQAVYFPPSCPLALSAGEALCIDFIHDAYSMHFNLHRASFLPSVIDRRSPFCHCLTHIAWPRSRFAQLSSLLFRQDALSLSKLIVDNVSALQASSIALVFVSDASILPLQLHRSLSSKNATLFHFDSSPMSRKIMEPIYRKAHCNIKFDDNFDHLLDSLEGFVKKSAEPIKICVVAEPFSTTALLPWNAIQFWYAYGQILHRLPHYSCQLLSPTHLRIWAVAMEFDHLWKLRSPIGADCEGFDLRLFNDVILAAAAATDAPVEPQPLWEYAGKARSMPSIVFDMSLLDPPTSPQSLAEPEPLKGQDFHMHTFLLSDNKTAPDVSSINAVALWAEWLMPDGRWHAVGGPNKLVKVDQEIDWPKCGPYPGVFLLNDILRNKLTLQKRACALKVESHFNFITGEPNLRFSVF